ncbi:MAG TPA: L-threonylcarbamoyladenylate synthase [Patescibacteria group bacterium]
MTRLEAAVQILKQGGVVVYPTDTAYGLAVDATNAKAVAKLYRLKGRDFKNPMHIIFPGADWLKKLVKLNKPALKLMNKFLPGPLTLVLPLKARGKAWQLLSAETKTLGVRLPNHPLALGLVEGLGRPITTTSANISGTPVNYSVPGVKKQFSKAQFQPDYYLDGGKLLNTKPSTVVSLVKGVKIIRIGPISEKQIKNTLN